MDEKFIDVLKGVKWQLHKFFLQQTVAGQRDKAQEAKDLVQETATRALPFSRKEEYKDRPLDLIWVVAWNVLIRYRKKVRRQALFYQVLKRTIKVDLTDPTIVFMNKDRWRALYENMDPITRQICQMRCAGYRHAEIAAQLGMTKESVKMRLQRLKK